MTTAYPLAWPAGWRRTGTRKRAMFGKTERSGNGTSKKTLSIAEAMKRVRAELQRLGVDAANDVIVSTNLKLNLSGMPRGDQGEPADPGVAVYWVTKEGVDRVMALDTYTRVADNIAAVAASLNAMRAIERQGGAQILDRAFAGFVALPAPRSCWDVLGIKPGSPATVVQAAYRERLRAAHPDTGGSDAAMSELNRARDEAMGAGR